MTKKLLFLFFFYYSINFSVDKVDAQSEAIRILNHSFDRSISKLRLFVAPLSNFVKNSKQQELTTFKKLVRNKIEMLASGITNKVADLKLIEQSLKLKLSLSGQQLYKIISSTAIALNQTSSIIGASNIAFESELLLSGIIKLLDEPTFAHATVIQLELVSKPSITAETITTAQAKPTAIIKTESIKAPKEIEKTSEPKVEEHTEAEVEDKLEIQEEPETETEVKREIEIEPTFENNISDNSTFSDEAQINKSMSDEPQMQSAIDVESQINDKVSGEPQIQNIIDVNEYIQKQDTDSSSISDAQLLEQKEAELREFSRM